MKISGVVTDGLVISVVPSGVVVDRSTSGDEVGNLSGLEVVVNQLCGVSNVVFTVSDVLLVEVDQLSDLSVVILGPVDVDPSSGRSVVFSLLKGLLLVVVG